MKIAIRALALGMLVAGFAATQAIKSAPAASTTAVVTSLNAAPVPLCQPGKSTCGMGRF